MWSNTSRVNWMLPPLPWRSTGVPKKQNEIIDECLQLHGGAGYMDEYEISRMYRDARVQKIYGGTNEIMKELISRTL